MSSRAFTQRRQRQPCHLHPFRHPVRRPALGIRPDQPLRRGAAVQPDLAGRAPRGHAEPIWDAFVTYRPLFLADATDSFATTGVRDRTGRSGNFAGQQIETRLRYWIIPEAVLLDTGITYLIKGRFLQDAPNAPPTADTFYGYLQTSLFF